MKIVMLAIGCAILLSPRFGWAEDSTDRDVRPLEIGVLATYGNDFDYHRAGGNLRVAKFLTRTFALGAATGVDARIYNEASGTGLIVPFDIFVEWDIPVARSRVSVLIAMSTGYAMALSTRFSPPFREHIVHMEMESGVKVELSPRIGLAAVMYGGMHYYVRYWPLAILGAKIGPCFWF